MPWSGYEKCRISLWEVAGTGARRGESYIFMPRRMETRVNCSAISADMTPFFLLVASFSLFAFRVVTCLVLVGQDVAVHHLVAVEVVGQVPTDHFVLASVAIVLDHKCVVVVADLEVGRVCCAHAHQLEGVEVLVERVANKKQHERNI